MHARFRPARRSRPLAVASGSKRRAWSATLRRRRRSSRSLVEMPPEMKRLTVESISVLTDESHAEAFREVGLEHMIGAETRLEFTTLGRSKLVESACIIVGEPEARIDLDVLLAFDLLASVPEFQNHDTQSGIDLNATLEFWRAKGEALAETERLAQSAEEEDTCCTRGATCRRRSASRR